MIKQANSQYDIHKFIKERWSPRMFDDRPVTQEEMNRLLEAARWAPSSQNLQPWRFIYGFKGTEAFDRIHQCLAKFNQEWTINASVLLLTAYKEKTPKGADNFHALHDLGMAMSHMGFQAQSMGIALHHMGGLDWKKAQEEFKVSEGFHITTAVAIGWYGGDIHLLKEDLQESETAERKRNEISTFAAEGHWPG